MLKDLKLCSGLWKCGNIQSIFFLLYCSKMSLKHFYYFRFPLHSVGSSSYYSDIHTDSILDPWYCNLFFNYVNVPEILISFIHSLVKKKNFWLRVKSRYERSKLYEYFKTHCLYNMRINVMTIKALRDHFR